MRPDHTAGHKLSHAALIVLGLLTAGCGQTGPLYLVAPPSQLPPVTRRPAPLPSTSVPETAACVAVPTPTSNVAPVAAPFPGTTVEGVPYMLDMRPTLPAPTSLTAILPACVIYPSAHRVHAPGNGTQAAPVATTRPQP